jgi:hypothetical protein
MYTSQGDYICNMNNVQYGQFAPQTFPGNSIVESFLNQCDSFKIKNCSNNYNIYNSDSAFQALSYNSTYKKKAAEADALLAYTKAQKEYKDELKDAKAQKEYNGIIECKNCYVLKT